MNYLKRLTISTLLLFSSVGFAQQADYSAYAGTRSTPFALQVGANAGYGFLLWGDKSNPFYGYLRPSIDIASSSTITGKAALDFYPVSFFGVSFARTYNNRLADLPSIDCEKYDCRNWLNFSSVKARLLGKYGSVFGSLEFEKNIYDANDDQGKAFGEGSYVVTLAPTDEVSESWDLSVGQELTDQISVGINLQDFRTFKSAERQEMQLLFAKKEVNEWSYLLGLGRFASSQFGIGPQLVITATWTGLEKIGP